MKIGIDIDEVLANHMEKLNEFYYLKKGKKYSEKDYKSYNWWETWGISREEAEDIDREYKKSELFSSIQPIPGAVDAVRELSKDNELFVVTSRHTSAEQKTKEWILKHFPFVELKILHSGDFWGGRKSKADVCKENHIKILIDDHEKYARDCSKIGIKVLLFDKPWNQGVEGENIIRVNGWKEVLEVIKNENRN